MQQIAIIPRQGRSLHKTRRCSAVVSAPVWAAHLPVAMEHLDPTPSMTFRRIAVALFILTGLHSGDGRCAERDAGLDSLLGPPPREPQLEPPDNVDPQFLIGSPNAKPPKIAEQVAPMHGLSLRLTADYPLRSGNATPLGLGAQGSPAVSPTWQLGLRHTPPQSYWFGQMTFYRYLNAERQQPWSPDFTYSFGYDDWHAGTFSAVYSNYTGNRFFPDPVSNEKRSAFNQGQWSFGYKFALPQAFEPLFLVGDKDQLGCSANVNLTPRYADLRSQSIKPFKKSLALGCRYTRPSGWYANVTLVAYPDRSQQQPWDPDFTYGFGYFDWRPGTISVQYSNYSGNRFFGHNAVPGDGSFRKGSISISWVTQW